MPDVLGGCKLSGTCGTCTLLCSVSKGQGGRCRGLDEELAYHFRFLIRSMTVVHGETALGSL